MDEWERIIGMKISAVLIYKGLSKLKWESPSYIFFDDGETFVFLDTQDAYTYHDCDPSARRLTLFKNKGLYDLRIKDKNLIPYKTRK
jgi:hypothetical protein